MYTLSSPGTTDALNNTSSIQYQNQAPTTANTLADVGGTGYVATGANAAPVTSAPVCFAAQTLILTARGIVSIDLIETSDYVVTASGEHRSVRWLGHRTIDCTRHPRPHEVMPVRIAAHAFGRNKPLRDLCVSPGHAICVDAVGEVLIPAAALVNGTTIVQEQVDTITYWHVELEGGHDIILAENLPCESYIEMGNRSFFVEGEATALHASPDAHVVTHADFCRPFHQDGAVVMSIRERLADRARDLGWTLEDTPSSHLHLIVDGQRVEAAMNGLCARFLVPAHAKEVWLMSSTSVPADVGMGHDLRALGVCVSRLVVDDGFGTPHSIRADHPLLGNGFYETEEGPQRWTTGCARLPAELWESCQDSFFLRVELSRLALQRWIAPVYLEVEAA